MSYIKTFKDHSNADTLDFTAYDFGDMQAILQAVENSCRRYAMFAGHLVPDKLILTPRQRELLPEGNFITTPYCVLEIQIAE